MTDAEPTEVEDPSSPLLYGQGQAAWLAFVTVVAVIALVLAFVAVVMASGDDGGGSAAPAPPGSDGAIAVSATEFAFDPAEYTATAGTETPVELENAGAVVHNWSVLDTEIASEADFDPAMVVAQVPDTNPGETGTAALTLDAGTYQVICTISGHFDAGMTGTLDVA